MDVSASTPATGAEVDADCIVVGGGIAGLVAARELVLGGCSVILLEATSRLGGKVRRHVVDGIDLDAGAESFATRGDTVADLASRLGLGDDIELPSGSGAWLQLDDSRAVPLPAAGMLGIPAVPLAADVIDVIGPIGAARAQLDALMPGFVGSREETLGGLVRRRMGRRVLDRLVAPVTRGVHSKHPDDLRVDTVAPGLRSRVVRLSSLAAAVRALRAAAPAGSAVAGIRGGISRLVDVLAAALTRFGVDVRLGARVARVDTHSVTLADGPVLRATAVVLAVGDEMIGSAERVGHDGAAVVLVTLVVRSAALDAAPRGSGVLVGEGCDRVTAKALTHATAKWEWLREKAGEHRHVLRLSFDADRVMGRDDAELRALALADAGILLDTVLGDDDVLGFARVDWVQATRRERVEDGIVRIGETASGTGLAAVVGQAQREARRIAGDFDSQRPGGMIDA